MTSGRFAGERLHQPADMRIHRDVIEAKCLNFFRKARLRALLAIEQLRGSATALALGARGGSLLKRVRRLCEGEPVERRQGAGGIVALSALLMVATITVGVWAGAAGDDRKPATAPRSAENVEDKPSSRTAISIVRMIQDVTQILALAGDFPRLWQSDTTSAKDKKRMLRLLVDNITVEVSVASVASIAGW